MDAALSIAVPASAAPMSTAAIPVEGGGEGGFAMALALSLGSVETTPLPDGEAKPALAAPASGGTPMLPAVAPMMASPSPVPETSEAALLAMPGPLPETPPALPSGVLSNPESLPPEADAFGEEAEAEPVAVPAIAGDALPMPSPVAVICAVAGPTRPSVVTTPAPVLSSDETEDERSPPAPALALPVASVTAPAQMPVRVSSPMEATSWHVASVHPVPGPSPEAEAAVAALASEAAPPAAPRRGERSPGMAEPSPGLVKEPVQLAQQVLPPGAAAPPVVPQATPIEATATPSAPPASPARQVSSVAVALAFAPGGSNGFRLSLEPVELGRVEIHVQRDGDTHSVRVTAERPETLALLQRDRHELDRGLAEAGLRVDSAGIDFSLDTPTGGGDGFGRESGTGHRGDPRGSSGGTASAALPRQEPVRPLASRSLLDLNI